MLCVWEVSHSELRRYSPIFGCCSFLQILASLSSFWKSVKIKNKLGYLYISYFVLNNSNNNNNSYHYINNNNNNWNDNNKNKWWWWWWRYNNDNDASTTIISNQSEQEHDLSKAPQRHTGSIPQLQEGRLSEKTINTCPLFQKSITKEIDHRHARQLCYCIT